MLFHCDHICTDGTEAKVSKTIGATAWIRAVPAVSCHWIPHLSILSKKKTKSQFQLQMCSMKQYKLLTLLSLDPCAHVFLMFCVMKLEICSKHFHGIYSRVVVLRKSSCTIVELRAELIVFFMKYHFYFKKLTKLWDLGIWKTFSWRWIKWACHFKENS